jgi:hypothetical protein
MKTAEHLSIDEKEELLILCAKILANFISDCHIDPASKDFNKKLIEGARALAPFMYNLEETRE